MWGKISQRPPSRNKSIGSWAKLEERDMGFFRTTGQRVGTAGQLFSFFWSNKRWWLTPILITLAIFAVLLILAQSSAIAPFIYSFF
jgi:Family of unknown function (DUF5989)